MIVYSLSLLIGPYISYTRLSRILLPRTSNNRQKKKTLHEKSVSRSQRHGKGWTNPTLAKQQWKENTAIYPADIQTHLTPSTPHPKKASETILHWVKSGGPSRELIFHPLSRKLIFHFSPGRGRGVEILSVGGVSGTHQET